MKSMAWVLSCSALCRSARTRISQTLSTVRLVHSASSHITFNLSRAYCKHTSPSISPGRTTYTHHLQSLQGVLHPHLQFLQGVLHPHITFSFSRAYIHTSPSVSPGRTTSTQHLQFLQGVLHPHSTFNLSRAYYIHTSPSVSPGRTTFTQHLQSSRRSTSTQHFQPICNTVFYKKQAPYL